jgi:amidase
MGHRVPRSYTDFLDKHALHGAKLAYDRRYVQGDFGPGDDATTAVLDEVVEQLRQHGAEIIDVESADPTAPDENGRIPGDDEFTALLFEFKVQIAEYLATLGNTEVRTLADLIQFNIDHCTEEMKWYGQEIFELAEATSGDLMDPEFLAATAAKQNFGKRVINGFLDQGFDAIISTAYGYGTSPPAISGYPSINVPVGYTPTGRPVGMLLASGFMMEPTLFRIAYAIEQTLQARVPPTLAGTPPEDPAPFDGCAVPVTVSSAKATTAQAGHHTLSRHMRNW